MTVTQLEPFVDAHGLAKHFALSHRKVQEMTAEGMPSQLLFNRRRYRISECEAWLERAGYLRREV